MKSRLIKDNRGVAAVEMAIILPVLILIMIGVLVYGLYFIKYGIVSRTVSTTATAIQMNPNDASIQQLAISSGSTLVNYTGANYVCAMSYANQMSAKTGKCTAGNWKTTAPNGVAAGTPYYVAVAAFVQKSPLVPLMNDLIPDIRSSVVVQVGGNSLPKCLKGQTLAADGNGSFYCDSFQGANIGALSILTNSTQSQSFNMASYPDAKYVSYSAWCACGNPGSSQVAFLRMYDIYGGLFYNGPVCTADNEWTGDGDVSSGLVKIPANAGRIEGAIEMSLGSNCGAQQSSLNIELMK